MVMDRQVVWQTVNMIFMFADPKIEFTVRQHDYGLCLRVSKGNV